MTTTRPRGGDSGLDSGPVWGTFATSQLMGFLFAFAVVWPLVGVTGAFVGFVLAWVAGSLYLVRKPSPSAVVGSGLYATAGGIVVTPIEAYAPTMLSGTSVGGATGAQMVVTGAQGLLVWVTVCGGIAVVMLAVGRYFKRLAADREAEAARRRRWYDQR